MRNFREKQGLKQKDLAKTTGLSRAAISLYENKKSTPSLKSAFIISKVLNTTVEELFGEAVNQDAKY